MKKILSALFTFFIFLFAQAQKTIVKSFIEYDLPMAAATCVKPTLDNGFAIAGFISRVDSSTHGYHSNGFLMKLDSSYNVVWGKKYDSGKPFDYIFDIDITSDSGFLLIGFYTANLLDAFGFSIIKADSKGNFLWEKIYPGFQVSNYYKTSDKGYILNGITTGPGHSVMGLTKIDSAFNLQWSYAYTSSDTTTEVTSSIKETPDHGFIVTGARSSLNGNYYEAIFLLKTDSSGMPVWSKSYNGPDLDYANDIIIDADSGFTLGGMGSAIIDSITGSVGDQELLLKTDKTGEIIWGTLYDMVVDINHIERSPDN